MNLEDLLVAHRSKDVHAFYAWVHDELQRRRVHKGIYLRALTLANGDEQFAGVRYVELRVEQLQKLVAEYSRNLARLEKIHQKAQGFLPQVQAVERIENELAEVESELKALEQRKADLWKQLEGLRRYDNYPDRFVIRSVALVSMFAGFLWYMATRSRLSQERYFRFTVPLLDHTTTVSFFTTLLLGVGILVVALLVTLFILGRRKELKKLGGRSALRRLRFAEDDYNRVAGRLLTLRRQKADLERQRDGERGWLEIKRLFKGFDPDKALEEIQSITRRNEQIVEQIVAN